MRRSTGAKVAWVGRIISRVLRRVLSPRAAFLAIVAVALFYAAALLIVARLYRKGYGIVGKPELALQTLTKTLARICF